MAKKKINPIIILVIIVGFILILNQTGFLGALHYRDSTSQSECNSERQTKVGVWDRVSSCGEVTTDALECFNFYRIQYGTCPVLALDDWLFIYCDYDDCDNEVYDMGDCSEAVYKCVISGEWQGNNCDTPVDTPPDCDGVNRIELSNGITLWIAGQLSRDDLGLAIQDWAGG